jgi:parallel beta-helix repeat protein
MRTNDDCARNSRKSPVVILLWPVFRRLLLSPTSALLALAFLARTASAQQPRPLPVPPPTIELRPGVVITQSARVIPRTYRLAPIRGADSAVIVVRGDNITVDFTGATIEGGDPRLNPDVARGIAIRVDSGRNVRIIGARIRGYRIGILARGTRNLSLIGNDLSYNWKPMLLSVVEHESLVDWLSFHHNEDDEWLRYGAGAYLSDVDGGEIRDNTVTQGMNGLMLVRTKGLRIWNNNFSFNSGVGIGLYRSSTDTVMHNRLDYNVRGFSDRFYRRGQDAADLLMYEQSRNNIVAYNSMTHGGDGVFLWAGQSTMDSGNGGASDNLFYGNDFSFAIANGIEATFSRNTFIANYIEGNEYGLWGGYSFDSKIVGNRFVGNHTGIAIEHGQNNLIASNIFSGDGTALTLWADSIAQSDWGYPKHRDTRSRTYEVNDNLFVRNRVGVRASATNALTVAKNQFLAVDSAAVMHDSTRYTFIRNVIDSASPRAPVLPRSLPVLPRSLPLPPEFARLKPQPLRGGWMPLRTDTATERRPRSAIVINEWGPYDYRSPILWPTDSSHEIPLRLRVLGPPGDWRVTGQRGIGIVSSMQGRVGDIIAVTPRPDSAGDWQLTVEYTGSEIVSPRGERFARGAPYEFSYSRFEPPINWRVRFYTWNDSIGDPRRSVDTLAAFIRSQPLFATQVPRLDYEGFGAPSPMTGKKFALEATGSVDLPAGDFTLRTISDDAVRVWVDGQLAVDNWKQHESAVDFVALDGGHHDLRVQYYQLDSWYELKVDILRGGDRSPGSPGAHSAE